MSKNLYEILGLSEEEISYFLNSSEEIIENEETIKMRDEIIKKAFEKRNTEIQEKYLKDKKEAEEKNDFRIKVIERTIKFSKPTEVNTKRAEDSLHNNELNYKNEIEKIEKQHQIDIQELEFSYEKLKSEQSRQEYNELLEIQAYDKEIEEISKNVERQYKVEKCDKHDQYNPDLLDTIKDGKLDGQKAVLRKSSEKPFEIALNDERNIKIKKTATVYYRNVTGTYNSYVNEYELEREIDGEEKKDTVYTDIDLLRLGFNKKNEPLDPNFYDCAVNKLFSEELIEGSKFNGGYIGLIEEMPDGKLETTIDKDGDLSVEEQENLAAVMTLRKREEQEKNRNNKEQEGEAR